MQLLSAFVVLLCTLGWLAVGELPRARSASQELAVIVHRAVPVETIGRDGLRAVFTLRRPTWPDGSRVVPFNHPPGSPTRVAFDHAVLGMDPDQVARFWLERKIRGQGTSIRSSSSTRLLLKVVARLRGSVTYVSASAVTPDVKVVARLRNGKVVEP